MSSSATATSADLEAQRSASPHTPHEHHGTERTEALLSESGLTWSSSRKEWVTDEEAIQEREDEAASEQSANTVVDAAGAGSGPGAEKDEVEKKAGDDVTWQDWDGPDDPGNPYNWSKKKKWTTASLTSLYTLVVAWAGASLAIGNTSMIEELGCSRELAVMALSAFPLGFGLSPLVLAPFSDGLAASPGSTMVGGTMADMFEASDRGIPMSLFSFCAFAGTGLGPAVLGYVAQNLGWRWIQYIQIIIGVAITVALIFFTRESRGSVILSRRAKALRKQHNDPRYQCRSDAERDSLVILIKVSMTHLLFTEAIVAAFSLWVGLAWGVLYLTLEAVALVMEDVYGFSVGESGQVFWAVVVAAALGFLTNIYQEKLYRKNVGTRGPEARLYAACVGGLVLPAGLFIFAFSQGRGHWMGPIIGLLLAFLGIFTIYLATFNYLADCYTIYASSALSGQSLCRNMAGCVFPLFTFQMYQRLGYQWASFLSGALALVLASTPFLLLAYGPKIRARSKFAKELERLKQGA
ncbi:Major Facilitator Superfamily protein [Pseudohyphozyma bogoriensis]|nr:Major Facilitator Superfamily protein [Pseudohyphozyma bogoriensis]